MTGRRLVRSDIVRIAVLASGSGTLLEAILADGIPAELVVVDRPSRATEVAEQHGVAAVHVASTTLGEGLDPTRYTNTALGGLIKGRRERGEEGVSTVGYGWWG